MAIFYAKKQPFLGYFGAKIRVFGLPESSVSPQKPYAWAMSLSPEAGNRLKSDTFASDFVPGG